MEGGSQYMYLTQLIPLKVVLFIYSFLIGISFGSIGPVTLQALKFLVSAELGYEGESINGTLLPKVGPCSAESVPSQNISADATNAENQAQTTILVTVTTITGNIPALLMTILAMSWSDSNSNKRSVALLPCVAYTLHMAIYAIISWLTLSPWFALIPAVVLGFGGNFFLQASMALTYMVSITDEQNRPACILILVMLNILSQGIAQVTTGYLIQGAGFAVTFLILALVCALTTTFVFLFLPNIEWSSSTATDNDGGKASSLLFALKNILATFRDPSTGEWNCVLVINALAFFFYNMLAVYFLVILQIITLGEPFCWTPSRIGIFSATKLVGFALGMTLGAKILRTWFDDYGLIQIGFVSMLISTIIPIYARTNAGLFLVVVFGAFRMVPGAMISSQVSKLVKRSSYGSLYGITGALECIAAITAPSLFGTVYETTVEDNPRFVFKLMTGMIVIPSALIMCLQFWDCTSGAANYKETRDDVLLPGSSS